MRENGWCEGRILRLKPKMKRVVWGAAYIFLALNFVFCAWAKEVDFEATVDRNRVVLGESLQLNLTFNGTRSVPAMELPVMDGFQARYLGPSTRMSIVNGQMSSSVTHIYTFLPLKTGTFQIGPLHFEYNGDTYKSNPVSVEVVESSEKVSKESSDDGFAKDAPEAQELKERVFLVLRPEKDKIYLNETIRVIVRLFVNGLGIRDIQFPKIAHDGFSIGEFEQPRQYQQIMDGVSYDIIEFEVSAFGIKPGEFQLGPAEIECNLIVRRQESRRAPLSADHFFSSSVFDSFFGGYETYPLKLRSSDVSVTILPLPDESKPAGFTGAMGVFDFEASVSPVEVNVGDPLTLKAAIKGEGNFNTVNLPVLEMGPEFKVYEPQGKTEKNAKTFEQVIIPLRQGVSQIPALRFSYFNTRRGEYVTLTKGPFPIKVSGLNDQPQSQVVDGRQTLKVPAQKEELGRDIAYIKEGPGTLRKKGLWFYRTRIFWVFDAFALLTYLAFLFFERKRRRLKTDLRYARQLSAPRKARAGILRARSYLEKEKVVDFYDTLFETLQEYLGDKFHLSSQGLTISVVDEELKSRGVAGDVLTKLERIFKECDMVRYASSQLTKEDMGLTLRALEESIDYLQRQRI